MSEFNIDLYEKVVSFDVYPVSILGNIYKNVRVLSIVDYDTARLFSEVDKTAVSVYPMLPEGTPKDFKRYKYLKLKHPNGSTSFIATHWVNQSTLIVHDTVYVSIRVKARDITDVDKIRDILLSNNVEIDDLTVL